LTGLKITRLTGYMHIISRLWQEIRHHRLDKEKIY